jgi:hypothetical protein
MAIITLRAWYVPEYEPLRSLMERPHDLRLAKNSLLKSALRADFLDEMAVVQSSVWFQNYLAGQTVEFYIEGSGSYTIANLDIISHEIYFIKQESHSQLEPVVLFSFQNQLSHTSHTIYEALQAAIAQLNRTARLALTVERVPRTTNDPMQLKGQGMISLKRCLLFVADVSPIAYLGDQPLYSPEVCIELGYALHVKRSDQIILVQIANQADGKFPFALPFQQCLVAEDGAGLSQQLPSALSQALQRFNLLPN